MATIVRGYVPADEFALAESLSSLSDLEIECERIVTSGDEAVMPLVWASGADRDTTQQTFQDDPSVQTVELLSSFENEQLYRMEWIDQVQLVLQMLTSASTTIVDAESGGERWYLRVLYPDRETLSTTTEFCENHELTFEIETIRQLDGEPAGQYGLTEAQYTALTHAVRKGYYDIPRTTDLQALATELDISHQALSERLRRATEALIEDTLRVSPPSVDND